MKIDSFISRFHNHPVLFIGSRMSQRYLKNSYTWEKLLKKIGEDVLESSNRFNDLKKLSYDHSSKTYNLPKLATLLDEKIDEAVLNNKSSEILNEVNQEYYSLMELGKHASRIKIYISILLRELEYKDDFLNDLDSLKKPEKILVQLLRLIMIH